MPKIVPKTNNFLVFMNKTQILLFALLSLACLPGLILAYNCTARQAANQNAVTTATFCRVGITALLAAGSDRAVPYRV